MSELIFLSNPKWYRLYPYALLLKFSLFCLLLQPVPSFHFDKNKHDLDFDDAKKLDKNE